MITVKKLTELPVVLRLRKIRRLCMQWRRLLAEGGVPALAFYRSYISGVVDLLPSDVVEPPVASWLAGGIVEEAKLERGLYRMEMRLEGLLGEEAVDWDFETGDEEQGSGRFPAAVYLEDIRSPFNVGAICRTAAAFGFSRLYLSPLCPSLLHPRARRSAMGAEETVQWTVCSLDEARQDFAWAAGPDGEVPVFGLETGGTGIREFTFPRGGIAVVGNEELGISPETLAVLGERRVSIPLYGSKGSLNAGVAFGILACQWTSVLSAL